MTGTRVPAGLVTIGRRQLATRPALRLALVLALALPLLGLPSGAASAASITWGRRAGGFEQPTQVTSARDGTGRLFVVEKTGRVKVFRQGRVQARTYLDLSGLVRTEGERGLLSIAFHPDFRAHPYLWAAFTNRAGNLQVNRFK